MSPDIILTILAAGQAVMTLVFIGLWGREMMTSARLRSRLVLATRMIESLAYGPEKRL